MSKYNIKCINCGAERTVGIIEGHTGQQIDWLDNNPSPEVVKIVSGRKRLDDNWGWQCICGNDDILTDQEKEISTDKQNPSPKDLATVIKNLIEQKPKFEMELV